MSFPDDYPFNPPTFRFDREFYHPNGTMEPYTGVLISIISLLADPNCSSPANVDAGVAYRKDREVFDSIVKSQVEASKKDIPPGFEMPKSEKDFMLAAPREIEDDENFWYESADGSDFIDDDDDDDMDDDDDDDVRK
ncbi:ubiquitin-conjugating enzyme/RWD-like protein [Phascolomyces articulosus]|uniref:Ubiquitin-conjugating enzyme/RWD-like protein n=1 Tax=Phascolomyces articulosus TaxID=60185 RepID=A0AAD5PK51_9FUNG|nr:ubiquitin-conjugating enzyme/RWD-like protein [Phascolomyces articulosus]